MERYKRECQKINEQINPSDEFIQDLKANLNKRVTEEKMKHKYYFSKVAMIFVTLTLISTGAFAKDIGNWLAQIFCNTDESVQAAVENGYVQNVDMDYIEHDGIAIKVNSLIIDDNKINLVFDVKGEIDGDLGINDLQISSDLEYYVIENLELGSISYRKEFKSINKKQHFLIVNISNVEQPLNCIDRLNIVLNGLCIMNKDNSIIDCKGKWEFAVNIDDSNYKNIVIYKYSIEETEYIEKYNIDVTNTGTNIQIYFKDTFDKYILINKEKFLIEANNGEKYYCRDVCRIENNMIKMNIPLTTYDNVDNFKIIINLNENDEKIILNAYKENSQGG